VISCSRNVIPSKEHEQKMISDAHAMTLLITVGTLSSLGQSLIDLTVSVSLCALQPLVTWSPGPVKQVQAYGTLLCRLNSFVYHTVQWTGLTFVLDTSRLERSTGSPSLAGWSSQRLWSIMLDACWNNDHYTPWPVPPRSARVKGSLEVPE